MSLFGRRPVVDADMLAARDAQTAEACARTVDQLPRADCPHKNVRPSCPRCARREALAEAARAVRSCVPLCTG